MSITLAAAAIEECAPPVAAIFQRAGFAAGAGRVPRSNERREIAEGATLDEDTTGAVG